VGFVIAPVSFLKSADMKQGAVAGALNFCILAKSDGLLHLI